MTVSARSVAMMGVGYGSLGLATNGFVFETSTDLTPDDFVNYELLAQVERALIRRRTRGSAGAAASSSASTYNVSVFVEYDMKDGIEVLEAKLVNGTPLSESATVVVNSYSVNNDTMQVFVTLKSVN